MAPALVPVGSSVPLAHKESIKMHTIDEIAALLHIHKTAHEVGNLTNISGAALYRLRQINEEMGPNGFGRPQEQPETFGGFAEQEPGAAAQRPDSGEASDEAASEETEEETDGEVKTDPAATTRPLPRRRL